MKRTVITLVIVFVLTALLLFTAFNGLQIGSLSIPSLTEGVTLGLDLVGGSEITYQAIIPEGTSAETVSEGMVTAQTMLRQRLDNLGYSEASVVLSGSDRIVVEIPNVSDPEEAVQMLGTTALIQFCDYQDNVILEGDDISSATAAYGAVDDSGVEQYYVAMQLSDAGFSKFKTATAEIAGYPEGDNYLAIKMDGEVISSPSIESKYAGVGLATDTPIITLGVSTTVDYAQYLAGIISSGHLPFELEDTKLQTVGAQLGEKSLETSIYAGLIGIVLVMLYMLLVYKIPGLVADIALLLYMALFMVVISIARLNLSLPGIAGIILTVGMAVDANVIIYERLREELRMGKTLKSSVQAGFKRAYAAIIDSNVTTLIAAVVLLWQGTGTILGFAKTLLIGVILSMICMLIVPNLILRGFSELKHKSLKAYGA